MKFTRIGTKVLLLLATLSVVAEASVPAQKVGRFPTYGKSTSISKATRHLRYGESTQTIPPITKTSSNIFTNKYTKRSPKKPTKKTRKNPTKRPTKYPPKKPNKRPTKRPTKMFTKGPTRKKAPKPTKRLTRRPTKKKTKYPTERSTKYPTKRPTDCRNKKCEDGEVCVDEEILCFVAPCPPSESYCVKF